MVISLSTGLPSLTDPHVVPTSAVGVLACRWSEGDVLAQNEQLK